jgi:hypothetical protein
LLFPCSSWERLYGWSTAERPEVRVSRPAGSRAHRCPSGRPNDCFRERPKWIRQIERASSLQIDQLYGSGIGKSAPKRASVIAAEMAPDRPFGGRNLPSDGSSVLPIASDAEGMT